MIIPSRGCRKPPARIRCAPPLIFSSALNVGVGLYCNQSIKALLRERGGTPGVLVVRQVLELCLVDNPRSVQMHVRIQCLRSLSIVSPGTLCRLQPVPPHISFLTFPRPGFSIFNPRIDGGSCPCHPTQSAAHATFYLPTTGLLPSRQQHLGAHESMDWAIYPRLFFSFAASPVVTGCLGQRYASHRRSVLRSGRVPSSQPSRASHYM